MAPRKKNTEETEVKTKTSYSHYIPAVPVLENFEEVYKLKYHLIKSYDELMNFYKNEFKPNSFFAWDTETSSLDPTQSVSRGDAIDGKIVGYSFTQNGTDGYYIPLCHPDYALGYKALKVLYAMLCKSKLHLLYNARFDMRFLEHMTPEKYGYTPEHDEKIYPFDLSKTKYFDVQCSVWLSDSNVPMPSLKKSEKHFLGWNPPTFDETTGGEANFGYLPAEQGYRYACIDALGTYHLFLKTERFYAEAGAAGKLDNEVLYPIMKLENTPIYVDHDYLASMRGDILKHLEELKQYLYTEAGTEYNISSGRELAKIFQQMGIDTGERTATGQMKTDIKTINNYQTTHGNNTYLKKLVEYKQLLKFDNSYLETLLKISTPEEVKKHPIRFNYFTCRVPTGRLASGTDGKNTFFSPVNFQCLKYDTRVLTKDGIKQIKDIVTGDEVWDGHKFTQCKQLGYKKKELIRVSCGKGHFIEASKEHQVYACKNNKVGWYSLGELTQDDYLAINRKYENANDVVTYINKGNTYNPLGGIKRREIHIDKVLYDFWFMCGYLVGDGCFFSYKDNYAGFTLCVPKAKLTAMDRLLRGFAEVGIEPYKMTCKKEGYEPGYSLNTKSANLAEALIDIGFKHLAKNKCIPDIVFHLSPRQKFAFIDGMISTDGTVGTSIVYKTTSKQLATDLRDLLETVGYYSTVTECEESVFNVIIHDKIRFRSEIGLTVAYKNEALHTAKTTKCNGLPHNYYKKIKRKDSRITSNNLDFIESLGYEEATFGWKKISNIEDIGEDIVYDLYVEESHRFTANGFIVHNSLPKPHSHNYHCHKATDEQIAKGEDLCGWIFDDNPEGSLGLAEGQDPHLNVRKAFVPKDKDSVIVSVDMCLEGGSPVQTKRGYIGISDLKVDDEIYTQNGYVKVTRVKNTGLKKLFKIKTSGQSIYCSEDHPFIINGKQVQANHVKETLIQEDIPTYIEYNIKKELISNKFIDLENIGSIVEKANYIKNNNLINDFIEAYNNYTASDIAKMCFIKNSSFRHIINYLNLNKKCHKEFCRLSKQHVFNPFKSSNPTSAYLLGYILGDGNISVRRNNYYTLNITSKDYEHINQIKNIFDNNIQLVEYNKNGHKAWSLTITDQDVCNDLIKLGIIPRKSYCNSDINFNWVGDNLSHFIRGLIDSDGCIRTYNKNNNSIEISISGNASYLTALNRISEYDWSIRDIKNSKCSILRLLGNSNSNLDFYKYIYKNATIWLQRKRDIYDNWIISKYGELPEFEMYDITIDSEDHIYFCNGVLTHNCAEELRLAANVFNEPTWIDAFNTGKDVHKACYSDDTEFLTKDGWKTYDKIAEDTLIAQYDNGNISYVQAGPVYYGSTGELYRFKTKYNDLLVTSNHRMLYRTSYRNKEKIKPAEDLNYGQFRNAAVYDCDDLTEDFVFEDCYGDGFNINKKYADGFSLKPDTLIKFLGFYFGDGHAGVHNNTYRINLIQSCCEAKKETLQWVRDLNKEMGNFFKEYFHSASVPSVSSVVKNTSSPYYTFERSHKTFCKWIIDNCIKDGIKRIPEFIFNLSLRQRKLFIDAFFKAGGTHDKRKGRKGFTLYIYYKELLDDFQRLCIMSNYSTYIDYKHKQISGIYRMLVHPNVWHNFNKINITKEFYNGKTVCYSVPSGVLIVRRNGKVSICGNTAIKIFGEEKYCKEARKRAKTANFGILYGSSAYGFHNQFPDMSLEECEDFIEKFKAALPSIEAGQLAAVRYGKKNGYVKTYFGRPRRVKYYFNSPDRSMQGFGKRTCMNTIIQGAAGDLIKLMLIRLWNDLFVPYKDRGVYWLGSIHDEINVAVPKSLLNEVVPIMLRCMTVILPDWKVPMLPDPAIGFSFGSLIPFDLVYNEDGTVKEFVPQMEPLKTDEAVKEPVEDTYIPEIEDDDYDYLQ